MPARPAGGAARPAPRPWACCAAVGARPAAAQFSDRQSSHGSAFRRVPKVPTAHRELDRARSDPNAQMLVRADELQYDNANNRILAVGNVQIYYKRLHARGRQGHLRAEDQAHARRRQRPPHRSRRQGRARRDHRPDRPVPRRLRRFAAARSRRQDPLRGAARRAHRTAATRCSRAASIRPASRARTIRASRRAGRCARRASSTTKPRR